MIAAIMQPYFFPYIGYFQLMSAVDTFVFYDDVQYINRGWVNRNLIRFQNRTSWLSYPVRKGSRSLPINQREYLPAEATSDVMLNKLRASYASASFADELWPILEDMFNFPGRNVAEFNANVLKHLASSLGIRCEFLISSKIDKPSGIGGAEKIIHLCQALGARQYINPIGGMGLYDRGTFDSAGIELSFLRTTVPPVQLEDDAQPLSIIDTLMHVGFNGCDRLLAQYEMVPPSAAARP